MTAVVIIKVLLSAFARKFWCRDFCDFLKPRLAVSCIEGRRSKYLRKLFLDFFFWILENFRIIIGSLSRITLLSEKN